MRAVLNVCKRMTSVGDVVSLLELITIETKELLNADRVSIFLLDREKCELWSMISQEKRIIRFDARLGIAGSVAMTGQTINVADAYEHPLFHKEVDLKTGYRTRTLLAVPLRNLQGNIIGVGEAINKAEGLFSDHPEHHRHELQDSIDHPADRPDSRLLGGRLDRGRERHRQRIGSEGLTPQ